MTASGLAVVALAVTLALAVRLSPQRSLAATIRIAAPPARVWAVLTDLQKYGEWNRNMRLIGNLVQDATIENIVGQGGDQAIFWPTVLAVDPGKELRWLGHYKVPGIFDAEHCFLLRPDGFGTVLMQGEMFHGLALWGYDVQRLMPDFISINESLKARAEALSQSP